ncbi:ABC transporter substrate-binding protein [Evansella sp. AB-P1]|uniref:ABC transporter substrate-binding protein n=1 Tax=Evansella sp. AB-P1 TaxID=3037653 RepID=UPI00241FD880|nr:ABC transporter substrate-binding protein [Evansella sp. AB-P1]MDG5787214.1 ABC transporter substrate-binding protein [Evansella sp. AB-P1]
MKSKRFLFFSFLLLPFLSILLIGCFEEDAATDLEDNNNDVVNDSNNNSQNDDSDSEFGESPYLSGMDLPSVEERLPKEPKVVNEFPDHLLDFEIGQYGGELRMLTNRVDDNPEYFIAANEPLINTPGLEAEEFTPNILKDFEVNEDQTEFTFYMREGLRWSDGEYVTVEDVQFAIEDVMFNEEITPTFPIVFRDRGEAEGEPMQFEVLDDYSFKISFNESYGGFIARIAMTNGWRGYTELLKPSHYLKQFHADYTPVEEMAEFLEEEGLGDGEWVQLFSIKDVRFRDLGSRDGLGLPVLYPWVLEEINDGMRVFSRNPYYFKVDSAGNQLPYIDEVHSILIEDQQTIVLETISGGADFVREWTSIDNMPMYRENEEQHGFRAKLMNMHLSPATIMLNMTNEDESWREVVQDVTFRKALSHAVDREEIVDAMYYGFAEPSTITDHEYDVDLANSLLDEMGMEVGSDGYRKTPSGEDFRIDLDFSDNSPEFIPIGELMLEYWGALDLNVNMRTIDYDLRESRRAANEVFATMVWQSTPLWYYPDSGDEWGRLWGDYYESGGTIGEEPPEFMKEYHRLLDKLFTVPVEEAVDVDAQMQELIGEHVLYIDLVSNAQQPLIVNANLGNIPEDESGATAISVNASLEQVFFRQ